jgi:histidinol-phosphate aminotransferase
MSRLKLSRRSALRQFGVGAVMTALPSMAHAARLPSSSAAARRESDGKPGPIRLDLTGNCRGPSPRAIAAMQDALGAVLRSDEELVRLREAIARHHRVDPSQIVLGCGSGEILRMAAASFTGPGKTLVVADPTCPLVTQYAVRGGARVVSVPLRANYAHDLSAMAGAIDGATGLVYICNPNNPTGTLTRRQDLEAFLRRIPGTPVIVIDEAYHDYVEPTPDTVSFLDQPFDDERLMIVRSFSKLHGMDGMRVGYAVTTSRLASLAGYSALEDNVNVIAARGAAAALDDDAYVRHSVDLTSNERQEFVNQAYARMLPNIDSVSNFVMLDTLRQVGRVLDFFRGHGIILAPPVPPPFDTHLRVSLGTPSEMQEFWRVWDLMPIPPRTHRM